MLSSVQLVHAPVSLVPAVQVPPSRHPSAEILAPGIARLRGTLLAVNKFKQVRCRRSAKLRPLHAQLRSCIGARSLHSGDCGRCAGPATNVAPVACAAEVGPNPQPAAGLKPPTKRGPGRPRKVKRGPKPGWKAAKAAAQAAREAPGAPPLT